MCVQPRVVEEKSSYIVVKFVKKLPNCIKKESNWPRFKKIIKILKIIALQKHFILLVSLLNVKLGLYK